jgi:potassium voltage-gated channel Eag-related subfamily H protein 7
MTRKFQTQLDHIVQAEKYLLKPGSYWMQQWDHVMVLCLIFTALVTPYEASFSNGMSSFSKVDALFVSNRLVDVLFLCDMAISFNLMYYDGHNVLVKSRKRIWRHYLCGWFSIDLITVLPYDAVGYLHLRASNDIARIRSLRVLRLLKLLRYLRASRVFLASQTRFGISTSVATVMKVMLTLILLNHWLACVWGMAASLQPKDRVTWLSVWLDGQELTSHECTTAGSPYANAAYRNIDRDHGKYFYNSGGDMCWYHSDVYAACLHWSTMTVTSIGYGDIVPTNTAEYLVSVACMFIAGVSWAMIIGEICGIANSRDPIEAEHGQTMDDVNTLMCSLKLPQHLRQEVRRFVLHSKSALKAKAQRAVISKLSPLLRSHMTSEGELTTLSVVSADSVCRSIHTLPDLL